MDGGGRYCEESCFLFGRGGAGWLGLFVLGGLGEGMAGARADGEREREREREMER